MSYPYSIPAIETFYRGCRFRSRLEARWAVFFQTLGLSWEYEPEGFTLSTKVPYLPDFLVHLKDKPLWAEVANRSFSGPVCAVYRGPQRQPWNDLA